MTTVELMQKRGELIERHARYVRQHRVLSARNVWLELHRVTQQIIKRELRDERRMAS